MTISVKCTKKLIGKDIFASNVCVNKNVYKDYLKTEVYKLFYWKKSTIDQIIRYT